MDLCAPAVYRPRRPEKSHFYQAVIENLDFFFETYDQRFLEQHGPLTFESRRTLEGFLRCGLLSAGFARARCPECGHEIFVAFSCQYRGVCPSCQQKRAEILCRFVVERVLEPVAHRQLVFVLPKNLRRPFYQDRELLGGLCRAAVEATHDFFRAAFDRKDLRVGMIVVPQRFGERLNPHIHLHALATDGTFDPDGEFYSLPLDMQYEMDVLRKLFQKKVLDLMVRRKRLSPRLGDEIQSWRHSGFSVDGSVRVPVGDYARLRRLIRYLARPAISTERVDYDPDTGQVTVRSTKKKHGVRPVVAQYDALTFLALLALQVPPRRTHMVRYFGYYSVRARAKRRAQNQGRPSPVPRESAPPHVKECRRRWAELLRLVFEVDPLRCPHCSAQMKILAFISNAQSPVIDRILSHLGEATTIPRAHGPPPWLQNRIDSQESEDFSQMTLPTEGWEPA